MTKDWILLDLEATCERGMLPTEHEIIELGAVKLSSKGRVVDTFDRFVRPMLGPQLTRFCMELTHITQDDVDQAEHWPNVCADFQQWIGDDYVLCSWGAYDKKQLQGDCEIWGMDDRWVQPHLNLKTAYQHLKKLSKPMGLQHALTAEAIPFEGTPHRAIADATNMVSIAQRYWDEWTRLSWVQSLTEPPR